MQAPLRRAVPPHRAGGPLRLPLRLRRPLPRAVRPRHGRRSYHTEAAEAGKSRRRPVHGIVNEIFIEHVQGVPSGRRLS